MKNLVAILLLAVHLFAYTDMGQVFKIPNLIEHYQEHHSENRSVGFIDFLMMHYVKCDDGNPNDDREDMQLPFKTIDLHVMGSAIVVPQHSIAVIEFPAFPEELFYSYFTRIIPSALQQGLLRPPIS